MNTNPYSISQHTLEQHTMDKDSAVCQREASEPLEHAQFCMMLTHLCYKLTRKLDCDCRSTVTTLAFSPKGSYLAAGHLDGTLLICSAFSGEMLHEVYVASGVSLLSILWIANNECQLLCGLGNGVVISVTIATYEIIVTGFHAHDNLPVECLSISGSTVVTGVTSEVSLWHHSASSMSCGIITPPLSIVVNSNSEIIMTSLHWAWTKYSDNTLLIAYLHHGILFWDVKKAKIVHFFYLKMLVSAMHISPDRNTLVVSNLDSGFDVYHLNNCTLDGSILHPCHGHKIPVAFIHGGFAVLSGSPIGQVSISDASSRVLLQVLKHEAMDTVLSAVVKLLVSSSGLLH
ncbi:WD40-repeat-containing domain protein [Pisolithus marmoratus]|nr:WD40-repeat-containing domain protein [Pisolithus marmoratus]